ncbi:MAG: hypothetical protein ACP5PJ_03130 [Acidimicrobiales bacterium]
MSTGSQSSLAVAQKPTRPASGEIVDLPLEVRLSSWDDPVIDRLGYAPDSEYVEYFWLPVLGPSSIWLLRRASQLLEQSPHGITIETTSFGRMLGLGGNANGRSLLAKTVTRCIHFDVARLFDDSIAFRRHLPPLNARQLDRLPTELRSLHGAPAPVHIAHELHHARVRARQMALSLANLGEEESAIRTQLGTWKFSDELIDEALTWVASLPQHGSA